MRQKEFSEWTGISQSTISDWKRKKTNPSADKILKICEVLGVTPYELLSEGNVDKTGKIDCMFALHQFGRKDGGEIYRLVKDVLWD